MAKGVQKQIEEYKKSIISGRENADKVREASFAAGTWGVGSSGAPKVTDPITLMQRKREEALQPKDITVPTNSQIRADAARKRLERLRTDYDAKTKARADKQKEDQFYSDLVTGDPSIIAPMAAPDEEENRLRRQVEQADNEVKYWENRQTLERDAERLREGAAEIEAMSEEDRAAFEKYANKETYVKAEDLEAYKNLKNRYGDRLDHLVMVRERNLNQQRAQAAAEKADARTQSTMGKVLQAPVAVVGNIISGVTGTAARVNEMVNGTGEFELLDANTLGDLPSIYAQTVQEKTVEDILGEEGMNIEDGVSGRELGALAYQGVMGAAETGGRLIASGGNAGLAAALAASQSWSNTIRDATAKGATPEQAYALATVNAGIEAATEKLPLDELIKVAKGGSKQASTVIWNILKQAGIEATEEEVSLIGTTLAEAAILQEKSGYNQQVMEAVLGGATYEDARAQTNHALLAEAINTALVSGISGGISAGGAEYRAARHGGSDMIQQPENPEIRAEEQRDKLTEEQEQRLPEKTLKEQADPEQLQIEQLLEGIREEPKAQRKPDRLDEAMQELFTGGEPKTALVEQQKQNVQDESTSTNTDPDLHTPEEQTLIDEFQNSADENLVHENGTEANENPAASSDYYDEFEDWGTNTGREGVENPMADRNYSEVGKRSVKAYMYENPAVKPFYQEQAAWMLSELADTTRGERTFNEQVHYDSGGEKGWSGTKRHTSESIAELLDQDGMTYDQIEQGLNAIINDNGQENNAVSKRIEFIINDRLMNGYRDFFTGKNVPGNAEYLAMLREQQSASTADTQMGANDQSPEGGQIKGTGAAERNFSGKAAYQDLLTNENTQPDRPGDVRPMEIPKTDGNGKHVTEFAANAYGAGVTTDEMANTIESLIQDGELGFNVRTNRESLNNAASVIKKRGPAATRKQLTNRIDHRKIQDGDIEQGILLYARYAEQGDNDNASEMLVDLAQMANITGRNLQMFKLLRRMTVEGQVMTLQKEVQKTVENMIHSGQVKKGYEPSFDPELMDDYRKALEELRLAKDPKAQETAKQKAKEIQDAVYAAEAAKMPATFKAKWDAWRYMAMLGNAKTQIRNVAGNIMFEPYKATKDKMAALFEKALPQDQRTKALVQDPGLLKWARADAKSADVQDALKYTAKLGDDATSQKIAEQKKVFDSKALEGLRRLTAKAPQAGDMLFKNDYYARSLAGFLKARGYSAQQIQNGEVSADVMAEARSYAIDEAMKATFNDSNAFSDAVASIGRRDSDNPWVKTLSAATEGVLPFRRTPANILVRFSEYSPAGLAKGMWNMATHVRKGDLSAAAAIDQITAGLTGSGMMYLGYMMAAGMNGIKLTGSGTEEDEKRQGHQDYALEFSIDGKEYSYRIDWAAPANLPLFVGANIYNAMQKSGADPDVSKFTSILRGMGTAFEPMLALSCMSSLNDLVESTRYAEEGEALYTIAANMATSYFTQGIPALARQAYQASQQNKQATFANDPDPTIRDLQKTAAQVPFLGDQFQTEKRNAWGETEEQGSGTKSLLDSFLPWETSAETSRVIDAFFNPGSVKEIDNSELETEISRLNEAQTESVTPPTAAKTLSYTDRQGEPHKDVRLTEEQYQTLAQTQGQTAKRILDSMIGSKDYSAMTDSQKAAAIREVYSYARKTGEIAAIGDDHTGYEEAWMMELEEGKEADQILRRVVSGDLSGAMDALDTAWDKGYDEQPRSDEMKWAYDTFMSLSPEAKQDVRDQATGTTAKYIEAREKGVSHAAFISVAESIAKVKGTGSISKETGKPSVRDADKREAIANTRGLSEKNIDTIMKCYMPDYDPENGQKDTAELKYDYIRQELGLSPKEYAETYRAYADNDKKDDQVSAMRELGYDEKMANLLRDVYYGTKKAKAAYMSLYED